MTDKSPTPRDPGEPDLKILFITGYAENALLSHAIVAASREYTMFVVFKRDFRNGRLRSAAKAIRDVGP